MCQVLDTRPRLIPLPSSCPSRKHPWQQHTLACTSYCLCVLMQRRSHHQPAVVCASSRQPHRPMWTTFRFTQRINTAYLSSKLPQRRPISISLPLSTTLSLPLSTTPSMPAVSTRSKNKTKHPGAPDMTPSQLASAGLSRPAKPVKMSMAKEIAALKAELHAAHEVIYVSAFALYFPYLVMLTSIYFSEPFQRTLVAR